MMKSSSALCLLLAATTIAAPTVKSGNMNGDPERCTFGFDHACTTTFACGIGNIQHRTTYAVGKSLVPLQCAVAHSLSPIATQSLLLRVPFFSEHTRPSSNLSHCRHILPGLAQTTAYANASHATGKYSVTSQGDLHTNFNDDYASKGYEYFDIWAPEIAAAYGEVFWTDQVRVWEGHTGDAT